MSFEPLKDRKFDAEMISEQARLLELQAKSEFFLYYL